MQQRSTTCDCHTLVVVNRFHNYVIVSLTLPALFRQKWQWKWPNKPNSRMLTFIYVYRLNGLICLVNLSLNEFGCLHNTHNYYKNNFGVHDCVCLQIYLYVCLFFFLFARDCRSCVRTWSMAYFRECNTWRTSYSELQGYWRMWVSPHFVHSLLEFRIMFIWNTTCKP